MDITEIHAMSNFELRKRIAEELGWTFWKAPDGKGCCIPVSPGRKHQLLPVDKDNIGEIIWHCTDPNWPEDIEDAYRLEESVPEGERNEYVKILLDIVNPDGDDLKPGNKRLSAWDVLFMLAHATACQKSEAWYFWKESGR
jgi:hypothetical protein